MTNPRLATSGPTGRTYRHPVTGEVVPSVTNVIGMLNKPALVPWAAGLVADAVLADIDYWQQAAEDDPVETRRTLVALPRKKADEAATRGSSVHDWLATFADGGDLERVEADLSEEAKTYLPSARRFLEDWSPEFTHAEHSVFGDGFGGTADFWAHIPGIGYVIGDYKTAREGRKMYPEIALQLAALRFAEEMALPDDRVIPSPATDCAVGVLIRPDGYELRKVAADIRTYHVFKALVEVWWWQQRKDLLGEPQERALSLFDGAA